MGFVRVKDPDTGAEFSISENAAKRMGVEVLDKPAVDGNGQVLPHKPATDKAGKPRTAAASSSNDKPKEG